MPARLRDIVRVLEKLGGTIEKPSSGSHWKAYRNGTMYTLPCGNGPKTELSDQYVRGLCRAFGLDEGEFRKLL